VVVVTEPRGGEIVYEGKTIRDGGSVTGAPGTTVTIMCRKETLQEGRAKIAFGKDREVKCEMSELKPFGR
jgi:hypothetical protein